MTTNEAATTKPIRLTGTIDRSELPSDKSPVAPNQLYTVQRMPGKQSGFTLITVMLIIMILSVMAVGSMNLGHVSEKSAGTAIQRSRAFQAADGGAAIAENNLKEKLGTRIFADDTASDGVFSAGSYTPRWWRDATYNGEITIDEDAIIGVHTSPRHILEEVGQYATDGGTGIVGLDLGSAQYGNRSRSGREVVVYRIESHGSGSLNGVQSVIDTVYLSSF